METLQLRTERKTQLLDITSVVRSATQAAAGVAVVLFVPHTTAGLVVQAAGAGARHVAGDVESALERLVDESADYRHLDEGDRNPWSHIRAALTATSVTIPLLDGQLALSELQAIFFCEFDGPRDRTVFLAIV